MIRKWLAKRAAIRAELEKQAQERQRQKEIERLHWCIDRTNTLNHTFTSLKRVPLAWIEEYNDLKTEQKVLARKLGYTITTVKD